MNASPSSAAAARPLAIVTGAARGIGAGIALELASIGFDLALTDIDSSGAEAIIHQIAALSTTPPTEPAPRVRFFPFDLAAVEQHEAVVQAIVAWGGPITCLVNNAGIPARSRGDLLALTPAAFDRVLDVNLRGTFFFSQAVAKHMVATRGTHAGARSLITISSVSAKMASIERAEYCISKAGLAMLAQLFALRLAAQHIGVFEVRPGIIKTPMTAGVTAKYDAQIAAGLVPAGRWGYPSDVAKAVAALAQGQLGFSTGSVLHVDGGLSIAKL